jgi:hypothetical protein
LVVEEALVVGVHQRRELLEVEVTEPLTHRLQGPKVLHLHREQSQQRPLHLWGEGGVDGDVVALSADRLLSEVDIVLGEDLLGETMCKLCGVLWVGDFAVPVDVEEAEKVAGVEVGNEVAVLLEEVLDVLLVDLATSGGVESSECWNRGFQYLCRAQRAPVLRVLSSRTQSTFRILLF